MAVNTGGEVIPIFSINGHNLEYMKSTIAGLR